MNETLIESADLDDAAQALVTRWGDGHASDYPLRYLRAECPCATCRTEREDARNNPFRVIGPHQRPPGHQIVDVEPVGQYGLRIYWDDGHSAGIYTFEYLREICPCEECRGKHSGEPVPYVHGIYIPK